SAKPRIKPKGRRDLRSETCIPEERCEILDPELEGKVDRIDFEESFQIAWRKGGPVKLVIARAKYRTAMSSDEMKTGEPSKTTIVTAPMPKRTFPRCLAAPSLLAKIATDKFADGLPLYRQEARFARHGLSLDRGTMCRWLEDLGMTLGCIVLAMREEA